MAHLEHIEAIEKRLWSAADTLRANSNFAAKFALLHEDLRKLNAEAATLAKKIDVNFKELMG